MFKKFLILAIFGLSANACANTQETQQDEYTIIFGENGINAEPHGDENLDDQNESIDPNAHNCTSYCGFFNNRGLGTCEDEDAYEVIGEYTGEYDNDDLSISVIDIIIMPINSSGKSIELSGDISFEKIKDASQPLKYLQYMRQQGTDLGQVLDDVVAKMAPDKELSEAVTEINNAIFAFVAAHPVDPIDLPPHVEDALIEAISKVAYEVGMQMANVKTCQDYVNVLKNLYTNTGFLTAAADIFKVYYELTDEQINTLS